MRTMLFILLLLAIIGGTLYWKFGPAKKHKILPASEWQSALKGSWEYKCTEESESFYREHFGEINFLTSDSFELTVTMKVYNIIRYANSSKKGLETTYGGIAKGKWQIHDDKFFRIISSVCDIKGGNDNTNQYEGYNFYITHDFGNVVSSFTKTEIIEFTKKRISIEGLWLRTGATIKYLFKKI